MMNKVFQKNQEKLKKTTASFVLSEKRNLSLDYHKTSHEIFVYC